MSALFSDDGLYRYTLDRDTGVLGMEDVMVTFVGLNPSTADATKNDPTIRRCLRFARDWSYGRMRMVNLYAYRATDPLDLFTADDPVGPENNHHLSLAFGSSDLIVAAWGVHATAARLAQFEENFSGWALHCLGCTKDGFPRHPLYVRATQQPQPFNDVAVRVRAYK